MSFPLTLLLSLSFSFLRSVFRENRGINHQPVTLPLPLSLPFFVARDRGSVHYLIRVLLSPEAFSIDRLARIVGLCARDLYRGSRVNPATRV